ncbi:MAG: hypothetical protein QXH71_00645, partial [Candidatus Anstonellaceae archaeon]
LRVTKVFLALEAALAQRRHFPAFNWLRSYSLYTSILDKWFAQNISVDWAANRTEAMALLQKEAELQEVVQLVGPDALPEKEQLVLFVAKMIREYFLAQNAYSDVDTYCSLKKQYLMLKNILYFYKRSLDALKAGVQFKKIASLAIKEQLARMKEVEEKNLSQLESIITKIDAEFDMLVK